MFGYTRYTDAPNGKIAFSAQILPSGELHISCIDPATGDYLFFVNVTTSMDGFKRDWAVIQWGSYFAQVLGILKLEREFGTGIGTDTPVVGDTVYSPPSEHSLKVLTALYPNKHAVALKLEEARNAFGAIIPSEYKGGGWISQVTGESFEEGKYYTAARPEGVFIRDENGETITIGDFFNRYFLENYEA
jgi:hypothetical protein